MLAAVNWFIRVGACVLIGVLTFAISPTTGRDLAVELAAYAIGVAVMAYLLVTDIRMSNTVPTAPPAALGVMAACAGVTCLAPNGGALIGFCVIAALIAGSDTAPLSGWLVGATAILAVEVGAILYNANTARVVGYPLILLATFIGGRNRRAYRIQAEQSATMLAQVEQLRTEQRHVAVLDERARIAREIHDVLAHSVGALGIHIQAVRAVLADDRDIERALGLLEQAQRMATDGLVETRRAVQALRGDATGLDEQIVALAQTHRDRHSASVEFTVDGEPGTLSAEATVALVRTTQEALVNAAKHAPSQPVHVRITYDEDRTRLDITNPLPIDDPDAALPAPAFRSADGGYGLIGMRERLLLINGSLTTGAEDRHWTVTAEVPR
jgi:signal transduction histidine kinase